MKTMQNLIAAIEELKREFPNTSLCTIEFGTIRTFEGDPSGQSTVCISQALGNRGRLISVDKRISSIIISREVCRDINNITWVESDSIAYMKKSDEKFHFVFLDTENDKYFSLEEFCLVVPMMLEDGILMVDDAGITKDGKNIDNIVSAQKGHEIWNFLKDCNAIFSILPYPNFPGTQIKIVFNEINIKRIKAGLEIIK